LQAVIAVTSIENNMAKKKQPDMPEEFPAPSEVPEIKPEAPKEQPEPKQPDEDPGAIPPEDPMPEKQPAEIPPLPGKEL
jgi:hypothetical protein